MHLGAHSPVPNGMLRRISMELTYRYRYFDFLKQYGYHFIYEDTDAYITYVGNNRVVIIYSEFTKEIYCQFEDIKTLKFFLLQDALDYQHISDFIFVNLKVSHWFTFIVAFIKYHISSKMSQRMSNI